MDILTTDTAAKSRKRLSWPAEEEQRLIAALREFGREYDKLMEAVENKTKQQVEYYLKLLKLQWMKDPSLEDADLLPLLKDRQPCKWTEEEKQRFLEAVREHGKDFVKIIAAVGSKTQS